MYQSELSTGGVNEEFGGVLSPIGEVLRVAMEFYHEHPQMERQIVELQDAHARAKKLKRQADARAVTDSAPALIGCESQHKEPAQTQHQAPVVELSTGRPRLHPQNLFLFAMARATVGGSHSRMGWSMMTESVSLRALMHPTTKEFPGATTVLENINLIDEKTLGHWQELQLHWIRKCEGSDRGWEQITVDSTAIEAAAAFPVDSALLVKVVEALWRNFDRFYHSLDITLPVLVKVQRWRKSIQQAHKRISLGGGKKRAESNRRQLYRQMMEQSILLMRNLIKVQQGLLEQQVNAQSRLIGKQARRSKRCEQLLSDCRTRCAKVLQQINERVLKRGKIAAIDKLLSLCDGDAALIVKGGREAVFGYKVQFAFNQPGYCTAALLNEGNASDSKSLAAVVLQQNKCSGIIATKLSVDDGYASKSTAKEVSEAGVVQHSVSGAKGKRQLGESSWQEDSMRALRQWRPASESRIFTFKQNQHSRRLTRFGRNAAITDILSKVLIFNIDCLLRRRLEQTKPPKKIAA